MTGPHLALAKMAAFALGRATGSRQHLRKDYASRREKNDAEAQYSIGSQRSGAHLEH